MRRATGNLLSKHSLCENKKLFCREKITGVNSVCVFAAKPMRVRAAYDLISSHIISYSIILCVIVSCQARLRKAEAFGALAYRFQQLRPQLVVRFVCGQIQLVEAA